MKYPEGRSITLARIQAGMTAGEVARLLSYSTAYIHRWENGTRPPHWQELYAVLPGLREIHAAGCAAYCPKAEICKGDGICLMSTAAKAMRRNKNLVEVVRCEHCGRGKVAEVHGREVVRCPKMGQCMELTDFCSYGKRRLVDD